MLAIAATAMLLIGASAASAAPVTIDARDLPSSSTPSLRTPLATFTYIVNLDNTKLPTDPLGTVLSTESNSPIVAEGDQDRTAINLPDGRYLISVRSPDHKMWGQHFTVAGAAQTVRVDLTEQSDAHRLPLGKIRVFVFNDNAWTNGAPDAEESGLNGFTVELKEQTDSAVTVDYNNDPLCGGTCVTDGVGAANNGFVEIPNLGPATYFIDVHPPSSCDPNHPGEPGDGHWYQTTTIDGGLSLMAPTEEGADGTGAPGEQLWEPADRRTAYFFGFVCSPQAFASPGTGEIKGTARNWAEWAPYTTGTYNDPIPDAFVALSDATTDQTVFVDQADGAGNFDIQNVPAGDYNLAVWDEQLSYIMRFKPVHIAAGQTVDVNETGDDESVGLGVSRWFGWLDGIVYKDVNNNGLYDEGTDSPQANTDVDQRWRDGSIKESTFTDPNGRYEYPTAEGGALGRWIIGEQGFARFSSYPGPSTHDERTGAVTPSCAVDTSLMAIPPPPDPLPNPCVPTDQGGGLLTNNLLLEGHRATVDWGKRDYPAGTPGQIVGITYFATTRNEFDARFQAHEDYEPAVPDVTVLLETLGPDNLPNTGDDVVVNKYVTDHWQQPNASQDPQTPPNTFKQDCSPLLDFAGNPLTNSIPQLDPAIGKNCLEVPLTGEQTKDGAFDGGYAFADYCPNGYNLSTDACNDGNPVALVAGTYITHMIVPTDATDTRLCNNLPANNPNVSTAKGSIPGGGDGCLYRPVKEEDVNVDLGNKFTPAIPPPPCTGDDHLMDKSTMTPRSVFYGVAGAHAPLCDKRLVVLKNLQNANADFNLMTNFPTDANGTPADPPDTHSGDVAEPGRLVGQVFNDIYFDRNQRSHWYGEPRPIGGIPVGIYARVDTVPNVNQPYTPDNWRLLTTLATSPDGSFEALVPSTETLNCPIPQGPCPGMYLVTVNDPGTKQHPNRNYNPNLLVATTPAEAWPGLTTQLDLPVDPISGTACEDPAGGTTPDPSDPARPDLLQVSRPYVNAGDTGTNRRITILSDFIGTTGTATDATGVRVTLKDDRTGQVQTLTRGNGGIVSWTLGSGSGSSGTPDTIVIQVPTLGSGFRPGPKQLNIITADVNGGVSSVNGITLHVLGTRGDVAYTPPVVTVPPPPPTPLVGNPPTVLQNAIDAAPAGSLLVLSEGTYNENVLVWKPLKIQGLGPGGIIGAHELQGRDPEDPRFNIKGSVIDGRFFQQNLPDFNAAVAAHGPYVLPNFTNGSPSVVLKGADLTVVAKDPHAFDVPALGDEDESEEGMSEPGEGRRQDGAAFNGARIDGLGLMTGHGEGAGGVQLQASINNMQITNNVLENNGGVFAGGIGLGQPYVHGSHNNNVRIANDRVIGNGGLTTSGGIGIFYGSDRYKVAKSVICSNFSVEYGAGISHIGLSPRGSIRDNRIYYNEAVDSGGGIAIESELPVPAPPGGALGDGSGAVKIERNLIQSNTSILDDGGGIFLLNALDQPVTIRNNMIVDNLAADLGGAILLDDSSKVRIVNNTIADNVTTASSENSAIGVPHGAGLTSEANEPLWQTDPRYAAQYPNAATRPDFSNPDALFNNIFWNNNAMTLTQFGPGATLVDNGFIDFEVRGTTNNADTFTPRFSDLTNGLILGPNGVLHALPGGQGNTSADPNFVTPFTLELTVAGSRLDPQQAAVSITGTDPPVGLTGDYHITRPANAAAFLASAVVDRGVRCSQTPFPAPLLPLLPPPPTSPFPPPADITIPGAWPNSLAPCTGLSVGTGRNRTQLAPPRGIEAPRVDFDRQPRPRFNTPRLTTPWDLGADELGPPGFVPPVLPFQP